MADWGGIIAGALAGGGEALQKSAARELIEMAQAERDARLAEIAKEGQRYGSELRRGEHADNLKTDIAAIPEKGRVETEMLKGRQEALLPGRLEERKQFAAIDTQEKVNEFTQLEPLKRKAAIDAATESLAALATPEMLKASRAIAVSKHIVDPSYIAVPESDGTVTMVNTKNPKDTSKLKIDGVTVIRKDPEELKAATSVINMAATNLRIAQAEHKATIADSTADPKTKAAADQAWKEAQAEASRLSAPAYAVLYGKAGIKDAGAPAEKGGGENTKTGYDPATKSVYLDGKVIGTAESPRDAIKKIDAARSGGGPAATTTAAPASTMFPGPSGINPDAPGPRAWRALKDAKKAVDEETPEGHVPGLIDYATRAIR